MERNTFKKFCLKLLVRIVCLDICCFVLSAVAISINSGKIIRVVLQLICLVAIIGFIYPVAYKFGDAESPLVQGGHRHKNLFKGLFGGLIASSPFIISGIYLLISKIFEINNNFVSYYKMLNSQYFSYLYSIMPVDHTLSELSLSTIFCALIPLAIIPLIAMFGYVLGYYRFSFYEKLFFKKKEVKA